jgi:hypothetical protein
MGIYKRKLVVKDAEGYEAPSCLFAFLGGLNEKGVVK